MGRVTDWKPIETAPKDKSILLWWTPVGNNKYAETHVIGQVSSYEDGQWYNGQLGRYQDVKHITHWMPLPEPPEETL